MRASKYLRFCPRLLSVCALNNWRPEPGIGIVVGRRSGGKGDPWTGVGISSTPWRPMLVSSLKPRGAILSLEARSRCGVIAHDLISIGFDTVME